LKKGGTTIYQCQQLKMNKHTKVGHCVRPLWLIKSNRSQNVSLQTELPPKELIPQKLHHLHHLLFRFNTAHRYNLQMSEILAYKRTRA